MKKFIIALMAFALVITLAGCGGGGGGGGFVLDRGDNGAALKDYGNGKDFTAVKKAYDDINAVFQSNDSSSDKDGTARANAFAECISENYTGSSEYSSDVSTKKKLVSRLKSLIKNKKFEGLEIIPYKTLNGATKTTVKEKTKLFVSSFKHNGNTYTNKEYTFESIEWVNEGTAESPKWRIVGGFDDLGKSADELAGK